MPNPPEQLVFSKWDGSLREGFSSFAAGSASKDFKTFFQLGDVMFLFCVFVSMQWLVWYCGCAARSPVRSQPGALQHFSIVLPAPVDLFSLGTAASTPQSKDIHIRLIGN